MNIIESRKVRTWDGRHDWLALVTIDDNYRIGYLLERWDGVRFDPTPEQLQAYFNTEATQFPRIKA